MPRIGMDGRVHALPGPMAASTSMKPASSAPQDIRQDERDKGPLEGAGAAKSPAGLTVLYDGSCPLCRREISVYQGMHASAPLHFRDVCDPALVPPAGTSAPALRARFHVQHADGRLDSGARAFLALWSLLPGWRRLARLGRLPGVTWWLEAAYRVFLRLRPALQALARRWEVRAAHDAAQVLPPELVRELRTDHAGETGAVMIYRGILAVTRDAALRDFAQHHLATEARHLAQIEQVLPARSRSRLLPLWRLSGWLTGALPACAGPRATYATIQAVETFVDQHYAQQVRQIDAHLSALPAGHEAGAAARRASALRSLRPVLEQCRQDEVMHRDDAQGRWDGRATLLLRGWQGVVGRGSAWAVALCRRL